MYNEIQLTKNKMDLNNRKVKNHPPSPVPDLLNVYERCTSCSQVQQQLQHLRSRQLAADCSSVRQRTPGEFVSYSNEPGEFGSYSNSGS